MMCCKLPLVGWHLRRFVKETGGTVTVEAVIVLPIVLWAYVAGVVFFDVFRTQNTNAKASYVIADTLSRFQRNGDPATPAFLEGINSVYDRLARSRFGTAIRITQLVWDRDQDDYEIDWSYGTRGWQKLRDEDLRQIATFVPVIDEGGSVLMVETRMDYVPMLDFAGIARQSLEHRIFVRPRFVPALEWDG